MRKYEHPKEGDLEEVKIELTKDCPLACIHCSSNASSGNPVQLSRETVLSLVSQSVELRVKSIAFSGGEPLLWPRLSDAVSKCATHGIHCSLYSTGINLTEDGAQEVLALAKYGLDKAVFSLYSPLKEYHEEITRKTGSFDKTVAVMRAIGNGDIEREIHFVPLKRNYKHLVNLIELAQDTAIPKVSILRFVPQGRGALMEKYLMNRGHNLRMRQMILDIRKTGFNIRTGSPFNFLLLNNQPKCCAGIDRLIISPDLNIYPCDAFKQIEAEELVGTLDFSSLADYSLSECWENSSYLKAIRQYLTAEFEKP